ncbi:MAG: hypothetical protein V7L20_06700 [Nostoc sp.]
MPNTSAPFDLLRLRSVQVAQGKLQFDCGSIEQSRDAHRKLSTSAQCPESRNPDFLLIADYYF